MRTFTKIASIAAVSALTATAALADDGHHGRDSAGPRMDIGDIPFGGDRHQMMRHMMRLMEQMHGSGVMDSGMGPMGGQGMDPMGGRGMPGMSMMDRDMMRMMMPMMDGQGMGMGMDAMPGEMMQSRLEEFDADGDGTLTVEEFADWHAAMLRETMVDRFQHLDADGDGAITAEEIEALSGRMTRMRERGRQDRPRRQMRDMDDSPMGGSDERPMRQHMSDEN